MVQKMIFICLYSLLIFSSLSYDTYLAKLSRQSLLLRYIFAVLFAPLYLNTFIHELGHAVVFILATRQPAAIVIGKSFEELKCDSSINEYTVLRFGLLSIHLPQGWHVLHKGCFTGRLLPTISDLQVRLCSVAGSLAGGACVAVFMAVLFFNFTSPSHFFHFFYNASLPVYFIILSCMLFTLLNIVSLFSMLPSKEHDGYWFLHKKKKKNHESLYDYLQNKSK